MFRKAQNNKNKLCIVYLLVFVMMTKFWHSLLGTIFSQVGNAKNLSWLKYLSNNVAAHPRRNDVQVSKSRQK